MTTLRIATAGLLLVVGAGAQDEVALLHDRLRDARAREGAIEALARRGADTVPLLLRALARARVVADQHVAMMILFTLAKIGPEAAPAAAALLDVAATTPPAAQELQRQAIWALGELGTGEPRLRVRLHERLAGVLPAWQGNADELAITLAVLAFPGAPAPAELREALGDPGLPNRVAAARHLARHGPCDDGVVAALEAALADAWAAWDAGAAGAARATVELARAALRCSRDRRTLLRAHVSVLMTHWDPEARHHSALSLRDMADADASVAYPLAVALGDGSPRVARAALEALSGYGDGALFVLADLDAWEACRPRLLEAEARRVAARIRSRLSPAARDVDALFAGRGRPEEVVRHGKAAAECVALVLAKRSWTAADRDVLLAAIAVLEQIGHGGDEVVAALLLLGRLPEREVATGARRAWQALTRR
jgi:hypothetical protein